MPEAQTPPPSLPKSQPSFGKRYSIVLAIVMYVKRKVDWYARDAS